VICYNIDMRISGTPSDLQIKQKLYFPSVHLFSSCGSCNVESMVDLGKKGMQMIQTNRPTKVYFECPGCVKGWTEEIIISLVISKV